MDEMMNITKVLKGGEVSQFMLEVLIMTELWWMYNQAMVVDMIKIIKWWMDKNIHTITFK